MIDFSQLSVSLCNESNLAIHIESREISSLLGTLELTSVLTSFSSSQRRLRAIDWSISKESYIGRTNNFSVVAKRSHLGVQMCRVIQV